ncbi:DUF4145 domain-containing protein [Burkholderia ubonensis]|uniref:DUF4145 domain-containing protein n=1 Tax=Burkholderia ubonensis TaxID=101571 RepID=UPI001E65DF46|nr:DUF4145 domain-containing protein [Burkholderia ubonensis]
MATIVTDCPHCGASRATFSVVYAQPNVVNPKVWNTFGACPACGGPLAGQVDCPTNTHNPMNVQTDLAITPGFKITRTFPAPTESPIPEYVPPAAGRAYDQGARCLNRGDHTPAAAMFRRCLEIALKAHSPEIEAWKLEKRIDKLAAERKITEDMKAWAHRVRLDGNDALHEEEEFTKETATELMEFTRLLLTYLYTLPEKIRLRLAAAE